MNSYEFDLEYEVERRRRVRRLRVVAAIVAVALLALTVLSTTFDVINFPPSPTPTTEPVFVALAATG
ncbi:MAG: hypothetical protein P1T08_13085 [Acidimicrobiia bacterium]|nr:hypothetical protein [Acidimicrobiia bacterium]